MSRYSERRSKASPMDFEYTSEERKTAPSWLQDQDMAEPPRKRTFSDMNATAFRPGFSSTAQSNRQTSPFPAFTQSPSNTPFLFHTPPTSPPPPNLFWKPPITGTNSRAGSMTPSSPLPEVVDISTEGPNSSPSTSKINPKKESLLGNALEEPAKEREEDEEEKLLLVPTRRVSINAANRVYRGRHRARSRATQRRNGIVEEQDGDSDDAEEDERRVGRQDVDSITTNHHYTFNMPGVPVNRSEVPYMLLGYVQFLFNLSLVLVFLYLIIHGIVTVQHDVEHRIADYRTELAEQIATCAHLYDVNKCFPLSQRVPALARQCSDWESCMQRDPSGVGRARVVAETIGEVINSLVEPISWKTLGFGLTSLGFLITLINVLFSFYRARIAPIHHSDHHIVPSPHLLPPAGAPPYMGPGTPVSSRIAPPFLTPTHHYMTPTAAYAGSPVEWTRAWSRTDIPVPGTPTRRKGRAMVDGKLHVEGW